MWLEHELVLGREEGHTTEDQLEELEVQVGPFHVGPHLVHAGEQVLHQDRGEDGGRHVAGQKAVGHYLEWKEGNKVFINFSCDFFFSSHPPLKTGRFS